MPSKKTVSRPKKNSVSLDMHAFYGGKTEISLKAPARSAREFAVWYTPGVGEVVEAVMKNPAEVWRLTSRANTVAIISDGTRVLGYGDAGPLAALSVMEGKAMLFKYLGGVDAVPLCIRRRQPREIVDFAMSVSPTFGGINLEDIASPACFDVLQKLRQVSHIPVWHDDAQGTAAVTLAGLLGALELTGRRLEDAKITLVGAGAANARTAALLITAGARPGNIILVDKRGALHHKRFDMTAIPLLRQLCRVTNEHQLVGGIKEAMRGADAVVAAAACGPGIIKPEWVAAMAKKPIVFSLANPVPEIMPQDALKAGAAVVATGRGDFPNQVNNCLAFPGVFRGVLDARAAKITDTMCVAAARAIAECARKKGLRADRIVPAIDDMEAAASCAAKIAAAAITENLAANVRPEGWFYDRAVELISRARRESEAKISAGIVKTF